MPNSPTTNQPDSRTAEPQRFIRVDISRLEDIADDAQRLVDKLQSIDWDDVMQDAYLVAHNLQRVSRRS